MAKIFKASKASSLVGKTLPLLITRLDSQGRGVSVHKKKPVFIERALIGEKVLAKVVEQSSKFIKAKLVSIESKSEHRVEPSCQHYKQCGGCDLQHLTHEQQISFKQDKVAQLFSRQGIENLPWQQPILGSPYSYRRKARVGVQYNKLGQAIVGFRQRGTNVLTPIKSCEVLTSSLANIFTKISSVLDDLNQANSVGHIEVIECGLPQQTQVHVVIRQLVKMTPAIKETWLEQAKSENWMLWLDDGKKVSLFTSESDESECKDKLSTNAQLQYQLNDGIQIDFSANDFIQVNHQVNLAMVEQALDWLSLTSSDRVLDLFCGLGNFSLPMAKKVQQVIGVEGVQTMVDKASANAQNNRIDNCLFYQADLNSDWDNGAWQDNHYDKVLLDPARAGAFGACQNVSKLGAKEILYVSCEPTTLAKDAKLLVDAGYQIKKIAIMDMFSQTKHVETMVLFESN